MASRGYGSIASGPEGKQTLLSVQDSGSSGVVDARSLSGGSAGGGSGSGSVGRQPTLRAIDCRNLERSYGAGAKKVYVLRNMSLKLEVGNIYGLLGASGCGKTTFLKCLLGRLAIHGGVLNVLGRAPGSAGHDVPGRDVGFMPQETALYMQFTIHEVLQYYAKLHGLTQEFFLERKKFLCDFLELPPDDRLVVNLSGGQQRRVSLCVALLHNPRLVILDEPTVGVDPLLRSRIWEYLVRIAGTGTSIIITTHYIEEARQANVVGLMRDGKLLDEGSPAHLMKKYGKENLEETFLLLCHIQEREKTSLASGLTPSPSVPGTPPATPPPSRRPHAASLGGSPSFTAVTARRDSSSSASDGGIDYVGSPMTPIASHSSRAPSYVQSEPSAPGCCASYGPRGRMVNAELYKGFNRMRRNIAFIFFQFLIPSFQVMLFCLAIGKPPTDIPLAIINTEGPFALSTQMLHYLPSESFRQIHYSSSQEARDAVEHGKAWGVLEFPNNFTPSLYERYVFNNASAAVLKGSTMLMSLDMSNQQISAFIQAGVQTCFEIMASNFTRNAVPPIHLETPIYGVKDPKFTDFIAPGMIISIAFAQAIGATAVVFVMDKKGGTMDRTWAAGVRPSEIMASQLVLQLFTLFVQINILLFVALVIFELPMKGSIFLVIVLALLLGMTGMLAGLVISALCEEEQAAMQLALGSFFPTLLLSGVIWPVEAIPSGLRYVSYSIPTTWAASSMRSIMSRGWGLDEFDVWIGFAVVGAWITFLFLTAVKGLKSRSP